jgi:thymidylate synthase ThyX
MQQSQRFTNFEDGLVVRTPSRVVNHKQKTEDGSTAEEVWGSAIDAIDWACKQLKAMGVATEDLRGLYPTNVTTNIVQAIDFNALRHLLRHRLCTQAQQEEWGPVAQQIKKIVTDYDPILGQALQPACSDNGKCDFNTSIDRPCVVRDSLPIKIKKGKLQKLASKTGLTIDEILKEIQ